MIFRNSLRIYQRIKGDAMPDYHIILFNIFLQPFLHPMGNRSPRLIEQPVNLRGPHLCRMYERGHIFPCIQLPQELLVIKCKVDFFLSLTILVRNLRQADTQRSGVLIGQLEGGRLDRDNLPANFLEVQQKIPMNGGRKQLVPIEQ